MCHGWQGMSPGWLRDLGEFSGAEIATPAFALGFGGLAMTRSEPGDQERPNSGCHYSLVHPPRDCGFAAFVRFAAPTNSVGGKLHIDCSALDELT
jgi:hypothetical protein